MTTTTMTTTRNERMQAGFGSNQGTNKPPRRQGRQERDQGLDFIVTFVPSWLNDRRLEDCLRPKQARPLRSPGQRAESMPPSLNTKALRHKARIETEGNRLLISQRLASGAAREEKSGENLRLVFSGALRYVGERKRAGFPRGPSSAAGPFLPTIKAANAQTVAFGHPRISGTRCVALRG